MNSRPSRASPVSITCRNSGAACPATSGPTSKIVRPMCPAAGTPLSCASRSFTRRYRSSRSKNATALGAHASIASDHGSAGTPPASSYRCRPPSPAISASIDRWLRVEPPTHLRRITSRLAASPGGMAFAPPAGCQHLAGGPAAAEHGQSPYCHIRSGGGRGERPGRGGADPPVVIVVVGVQLPGRRRGRRVRAPSPTTARQDRLDQGESWVLPGPLSPKLRRRVDVDAS